MPVHVDGRLIGWAANRAHHADVGGMAPGSIPPDATEIQQEGLRIPPVRLTDDVVAIFVAAPHARRTARRPRRQIGANVARRRAAGRVRRLAADEVVDYGERRMRAALAALPDGTWSFEDVSSTHRWPRPRIVLAVTVARDVTFDFTGTDPQAAGNVNAVEAVTVSCVSFALRSATDPTIPANGGAMRPVTVLAPAGIDRRRAAAGRGRRRQRRGEPAGRRRLPRRARAGRCRTASAPRRRER